MFILLSLLIVSCFAALLPEEQVIFDKGYNHDIVYFLTCKTLQTTNREWLVGIDILSGVMSVCVKDKKLSPFCINQKFQQGSKIAQVVRECSYSLTDDEVLPLLTVLMILLIWLCVC